MSNAIRKKTFTEWVPFEDWLEVYESDAHERYDMKHEFIQLGDPRLEFFTDVARRASAA
jgi:hypothetical protein